MHGISTLIHEELNTPNTCDDCHEKMNNCCRCYYSGRSLDSFGHNTPGKWKESNICTKTGKHDLHNDIYKSNRGSADTRH